jgi:branched-chain amino acid transport system substrate-binding protein
MAGARLPAVLSCALGAAVLAFSACGGDEHHGETVSGHTLTIYTSVPLQGPSRADSVAIENGAEMALARARGRAGRFHVRLKNLNDATPQTGRWDPLKTQANARRAVEDKTAIAYVGELDSEASANSIPILNRALILQVSPASTAAPLTKKEPGAAPGEPGNHYLTDERTFGRVIPRDTLQGRAAAIAMKQDGCTKAYAVNDGELYGKGMVQAFQSEAKQQGLPVLGSGGYDPKATSYGALPARIAGKGADCVFSGLIAENNGTQLFRDLAAGVPRARLYGPAGVAVPTFVDPRKGGVPSDIAGRIRIIQPVLAPRAYPRQARAFFADYRRRYGAPNPYAAYGYEALSAILDSVERAGAKGSNREAVVGRFFKTRNRKSVLGTYSIDKDGDTSLRELGLYRIQKGAARFVRPIEAR